jgi:transcriptional regulator with XRE-family HTH domain
VDIIDVRRLRGLLAETQVTHTQYARVCKLSRVYVGRILSGRVEPGELAAIKLRRGLKALGVDEDEWMALGGEVA